MFMVFTAHKSIHETGCYKKKNHSNLFSSRNGIFTQDKFNAHGLKIQGEGDFPKTLSGGSMMLWKLRFKVFWKYFWESCFIPPPLTIPILPMCYNALMENISPTHYNDLTLTHSFLQKVLKMPKKIVFKNRCNSDNYQSVWLNNILRMKNY